jgi:ribosomal peptide maturation radical SAM protein 1
MDKTTSLFLPEDSQMYKIALINMPFASVRLPSIALTQLQSRVLSAFEGRVSVDVLNLNHDFANYLGLDLYGFFTDSFESQNGGLGDWFFRQIAFSDLPDNADRYFKRYLPLNSPEMLRLKARILQSRDGLDVLINKIVSTYHLDQADMVGFTSMFMQNVASFAMAAKLKRRNPAVITVIGGANCESPMGEVIVKRVPQIDYVFSGPALRSFPDFVKCCLDGQRSDVQSIRGVFSRTDGLQATQRSIGDELPMDVPIELDYLPFLQTVAKNFPDGKMRPVLLFETSRGCWWGEKAHCTFCGLNGATMAYRSMSPEKAIRLFEGLFKYSGKVSRLEAVDNILPKSYLKDVLPFLNTPPDMSIFYEVKADLSEQDIEVLAKAGVRYIQPGIESLATSTLKLMKKGTTVFQNIGLLKWLALYGIYPTWNLLVGFPGEGEDVYARYLEVLPLLHHLYPPNGVYPVRFDRFSPYYDEAKKYGLDLHPLGYYKMVYPFDQADLHDLAYYFADENIDAPYFIMMTKWIAKLRVKASDWLVRWQNPGRGLAPSLFIKPNSTIIYDSRSGTVIEHQVGETGKAILDFLSKPGRIDAVSKGLSHIEGLDVEKEIQLLQQKGLLFQEGDRFLSLVLEGDHGSRKPLMSGHAKLPSAATIESNITDKGAVLV